MQQTVETLMGISTVISLYFCYPTQILGEHPATAIWDLRKIWKRFLEVTSTP